MPRRRLMVSVLSRAAVAADLVHRLDDQRIFADALLDRWQLAGLHQLRQLRRLLEALGELRGIRDCRRALELADQLGTDRRRSGRSCLL